MNPEKTKIQKVLALLSVIFLFTFVGGILFSISLNNRERTEVLRNKVIELKIEKENTEKLAKIQLVTLTPLATSSKSFLTLAITENGTKKILNSKNPDLVLPIASITKLMVAIVTLENINLDTNITATTDYIGQEESVFVLETDKIYTAKELLANALISSDNDSARLLSSIIGVNNFIDKMNLKAQELGLANTHYVNITGLDPKDINDRLNVSTVSDLANLLVYIKNRHPEILKITKQDKYDFCDINNFCKTVLSTNKLLGENLKYNIIGGKTGTTDLAGKNLALMTELTNDVLLVNIVLGSENNFADTMSLINHIEIAN